MSEKIAKGLGPEIRLPLVNFNCWASKEKQSTAGQSCLLYHGDARAVLRAMRSDFVSCAVTSTPYFWQRDYKVAGQIGLEPSVEGYVQSVCDVMEQVKRVIRPQGVLFLNLG